MGDRLGRNVGIAVGIEDSFGGGQATPKLYLLGRSTLRVDPVQTITTSPEVRPDPNPAEPVRDVIDLTGELATLASVDSAALLIELLTGNRACTSTTAPYIHTSKILANAVKSAIVEKWDGSESKSDLVKGTILSSLRFSWRKRGGPLILSWGFSGIGADPARNSGTRFDVSPTALSAKRHSMAACTIKVDTATTLATYITAFDLAFTFGIEKREGATGTPYADAIIPGTCAIDASIVASRPADDALYALCDGDDHVFEFLSPQPGDATRYLKVTLPQVRVEKADPVDESGGGMVNETFKLFPYFTDNTSSSAAVFVSANDVGATY